MASPDLLNLIRESEKLSLTPYLCPAGYPTQGYGRRVDSLDRTRITVDIAEQWLQEDAEKHLAEARKLAPNLSGRRLDALADLCYNVGMGALDGDDPENINDDAGVVLALRREDWADAAKRFRQWVNKSSIINGKRVYTKLPGLVKRREIGARWIEEG